MGLEIQNIKIIITNFYEKYQIYIEILQKCKEILA